MVLARPRLVRPALPRTFRSLRIYNYRVYWFGLLISAAGNWMDRIAQAWLVLDLTGSPLSLGVLTALQFLPVLVLSLFAGVVVDRVPKWRLIVTTQTIAMIQALTLAALVLTGQIQLWHVYALALVLGMVNAFDTPARQAFVSELVGTEHLTNAVALNSSLFNSARIVGPALGGVLIAAVGVGLCFLLNGLSFVAVIVGLFLMRRDELQSARPAGDGKMLGQIVEGLRFVRATPAALAVVALLAVLGTLGYNFTVVLPLLARYALGTGAVGFGVMTSAMGAGSLVAALLAASLGRITWRLIVGAATAFSLLEIAVAASPWYAASLGLLVLVGLTSVIFSTGVNTTLQLVSPPHLRGRVLSLYTLLFMGSTPIGGVITGAMADQIGIQWTFGIEAGICATAAIVAALLTRGMLTTDHQEPAHDVREADSPWPLEAALAAGRGTGRRG